jgi:hypothetical protein
MEIQVVPLQDQTEPTNKYNPIEEHEKKVHKRKEKKLI